MITTRLWSCGCMTVQSRDLEEDVADGRRVVGKAVLEVAADHPADDAVLVDVAGADVEGLDGAAVADDRDARRTTCLISLSLWLIMIEVMPLPCRPLSRPSRCAESSSFSAAVGSSRTSSLTSFSQRLRDLDELLLADTEMLDRGQRELLQPDAGEQLGGRRLASPSRSPRPWPAGCQGRCSPRSRARGSARAPGG